MNDVRRFFRSALSVVGDGLSVGAHVLESLQGDRRGRSVGRTGGRRRRGQHAGRRCRSRRTGVHRGSVSSKLGTRRSSPAEVLASATVATQPGDAGEKRPVGRWHRRNASVLTEGTAVRISHRRSLRYRHATRSQASGVSPSRRSLRSRASFIRHEPLDVTTTTAWCRRRSSKETAVV